MNEAERAALLARTWLEGLPEPIVTDAAARARPRILPAGQRLFSCGDAADAFYVIVSGQVRVVEESADGRQLLLNVLDGGKWFGEISILDEGRRTHSVECIGETVLLAIGRADFIELIERHPLLARHVTRHICHYLRLAFTSLGDNLGARVDVRAAKRLLLLGRSYGVVAPDGVTIDLHLSQEDLANMLGVTRQSVGRFLRDWSRSGWIKQEYSRITLCDPEALARIAGES